MERTIRVRGGLDVRIGNPPLQKIRDARPVSSVALIGEDYPGLRLKPIVDAGTRVAAGEPVFADRRRPEVVVTSPTDGVVRTIVRGPHRRLEILIIDVERDSRARFPYIDDPTATLRKTLLQTGLWAGFRTRPFGLIPEPEGTPEAIFVTTIDTNPLAADPRVIIAGTPEAFAKGVEALTGLTEGTVFVCQAPGPPLLTSVSPRTLTVQFDGPHPAGLAGTHIHHLAAVGAARIGRVVWHISWQEVLAIGHLLVTGEVLNERVVALAGPGVREPRLVRTPIGASLEDLTRTELNPGGFRVVSGSPLDGREGGYLGRYDTQVSVLGPVKPDRALPFLSHLLRIRPRTAGPIIPLARLDNVSVAGIPAVPLLRALSANDAETSAALGCLALIEEDVSLFSYLCVSKTNYGERLRSVLDDLAASQ